MTSIQSASPDSKAEKRNLHILIVGGSIAALTLANCLQRLNIAYIVLESHFDIAPNVGASIVISPNGARVLEQLGTWEDMIPIAEPIVKVSTWMDGKNLSVTNHVPLILARHGRSWK